MIQDVLFWIPDPDFFHPGSRGQKKAPDPGSATLLPVVNFFHILLFVIIYPYFLGDRFIDFISKF
jgi:hypothetical protein